MCVTYSQSKSEKDNSICMNLFIPHIFQSDIIKFSVCRPYDKPSWMEHSPNPSTRANSQEMQFMRNILMCAIGYVYIISIRLRDTTSNFVMNGKHFKRLPIFGLFRSNSRAEISTAFFGEKSRYISQLSH